MAYLIITAGGEEIDRHKLDGATVIGRSPECDVSVRDVLLSRRHCRIERHLGSWRVVDLGSRNGTRINWQKVTSRRLFDGDVLRVGRTLITFRSGAFVPAPATAANPNRMVRPADPFEALAGTMVGIVLDDLEDDPDATPAMRPATPLHAGARGREDEPDWLRDLPDESPRRSPRPRTATSHWTPPSPQPRLTLSHAPRRMTDLSLQALPGRDLAPAHLTRLSRMSDTARFMAIYITVSTLVTAAIITGMYLATR